MMIGDYNGIAFGALGGLLLFGSILGALQVGILKEMAVRYCWLWVIPSAVGTAGFALGVVFSLLSQQADTMTAQNIDIIAASVAGGVVYGVITGMSLSLLIRGSVRAQGLANSEQDGDY